MLRNGGKEKGPIKSPANEISYEWSCYRTSCTDCKVRTALDSIINSTTGKLLRSNFYVDIHTFGVYPQTQNLNHLLQQHNKQCQKESTAQ